MTPEQEQEITELRSRHLTPKQIARKLGLKVAEVTAVIKGKAEESTLALAELGSLAPIAQCLINADAVPFLLTPQKTHNEEALGLCEVLVSRAVSDRYLVATYLVDYWCLGLKDVTAPRSFDRVKYERFIQTSYTRFPSGYAEITLQQAQAVILGAIHYATQLGFNPHPDFEKAKMHLGEWDGHPQLEFGRSGKPCFVNGPYDDTTWVINTLRRSVGDGNFDYFLGMG